MIYRLRDKKNEKCDIVGELKQIAEFLDYSKDLNFLQINTKLQNDKQYHNNYIDYYIEETNAHVAVRETGEFIINVRNINQGVKVIEMLETEDDINGEYEPNWYDIVDDNHISLLLYVS